MNRETTPARAASEATFGAPSGAEPVHMVAIDGAQGASSLLAGIMGSPSFVVTIAESSSDALELVRRLDPEVVLVDLAATGSAGFELCRELRTFSVAYIVMLAGRGEAVDQRLGLSVGIDEYVARPSSAQDVVARIQGMLSRPDAAADDGSSRRQVLDLVIDLAGRTVRVDGREVDLTDTEFAVLATLVARPDRVVTRAELLQLVWGTTWVREDHLIDVHMSNLRRKLGDTPRRAKYIKTRRGRGYQLAAPPTQARDARG